MREGYVISFHELQVNARNKGNGRACRELSKDGKDGGKEGDAES